MAKDRQGLMTPTEMLSSSLIVIPCLNEAAHIGALLERLRPAAERLAARIVVADGGSIDGTLGIVEEIAARDPLIVLLHNPSRIQSAAVNLAVATFGNGAEYLIRIDAHGGYPLDYCDRLVEEALATGADSIVVSMLTSGDGAVQKAVAAAQNSKLGTGGSKHRHLSAGEWVDHGHHALMRISAFKAVGGYDETFSHNEDAEFDYRLRQAGYRIWMSGKTQMVYYPRSSLKGLYFQYLGYGRGRAKNVLKHRMIPKIRQMVPLLVFPIVLLAAFSFVHWLAIVPFLAWASVCLGYGLWTAVSQRNPDIALAGVSAMVMHFGWSVGFWLQLVGARSQRKVAS
jgi:succinoglycan biosynthesis protein ExoA